MERKFTKNQLFRLFGACVFPSHTWTIFMILQEFNNYGTRTNYWDAFGAMSYTLVYALFESLAFFAFLALIGFSLPKKFSRKTITFQLSSLILILMANIAAIRLLSLNTPDVVKTFLENLSVFSEKLNLEIITIVALLMMLAIIIQLAIIFRVKPVQSFFEDFFERLTVLTALFLVFDVIAIVLILIRNFT